MHGGGIYDDLDYMLNICYVGSRDVVIYYVYKLNESMVVKALAYVLPLSIDAKKIELCLRKNYSCLYLKYLIYCKHSIYLK